MKTFRNLGIGISAALWAVLGWWVLTHAAALDTVPAKTQASLPAVIGIMADDTTSSTITSTHFVSRVNPVAIAISTHYTLPVTQVVALHKSGYGYGEIVKLYEFALVSGKTATAVQQMRDSGMGWGQISKALNLPRGAGKVTLGTIMRARRKLGDSQQNVGTSPAQTAQNKRVQKRTSNGQSPSVVRKVRPKLVKPKGNGNGSINRGTVSRVKPRVTAPKGVRPAKVVKPAKVKKGR